MIVYAAGDVRYLHSLEEWLFCQLHAANIAVTKARSASYSRWYIQGKNSDKPPLDVQLSLRFNKETHAALYEVAILDDQPPAVLNAALAVSRVGLELLALKAILPDAAHRLLESRGPLPPLIELVLCNYRPLVARSANDTEVDTDASVQVKDALELLLRGRPQRDVFTSDNRYEHLDLVSNPHFLLLQSWPLWDFASHQCYARSARQCGVTDISDRPTRSRRSRDDARHRCEHSRRWSHATLTPLARPARRGKDYALARHHKDAGRRVSTESCDRRHLE